MYESVEDTFTRSDKNKTSMCESVEDTFTRSDKNNKG